MASTLPSLRKSLTSLPSHTLKPSQLASVSRATTASTSTTAWSASRRGLITTNLARSTVPSSVRRTPITYTHGPSPIRWNSNKSNDNDDGLRQWGFEEVHTPIPSQHPHLIQHTNNQDKHTPPPEKPNPNRRPRTRRTNLHGYHPLRRLRPSRLPAGRALPHARRIRDAVWIPQTRGGRSRGRREPGRCGVLLQGGDPREDRGAVGCSGGI